MFLEKQDDILYRIRKMLMKLDMVKNFCLVSPNKPPTLDPGIGKIIIPLLSKEK